MTRIDLTTAKSVKLKTGGKYCAEDISIVPNLETINVTPTTAEQNFSVGSGFSGIGNVKVGAIETETANVKSSLAEQTIKPSADNKYINEIKVAPIVLETAEIQPTTSEQVIRPSNGADGLLEAKIRAVNPADYYKPESVAEVTPTTETQKIKPANGEVFNEVKVGAIQTEKIVIKTNGKHTPSVGKFFNEVEVEVADIPAILQEKTVTPTRQPQTVLPDTNFEGMSKVEVGGIPAEFIVPSGSITATENKTYDVTEVKQVVVAVPEKADAKLITGSANQNGTYKASDYDADGFSEFVVEVAENTKEPILQDKEVTPTKETQVVTADEGYDGLNSTTVKPIPDEYIIPAGELEIKENNTYDVADKKTVVVSVPTSGGGLEINGKLQECEAKGSVSSGDFVEISNMDLNTVSISSVTGLGSSGTDRIYKISDKKYCWFYSGTSKRLTASVVTINTKTDVSIETTVIDSTSNASNSGLLSCKVSEDKWIILYSLGTSYYLYGAVVQLNEDNTFTVLSKTQLSSSSYSMYLSSSQMKAPTYFERLNETQFYAQISHNSSYSYFAFIKLTLNEDDTLTLDEQVQDSRYKAYSNIVPLNEETFAIGAIANLSTTINLLTIGLMSTSVTGTLFNDVKSTTTSYMTYSKLVKVNDTCIAILYGSGSSSSSVQESTLCVLYDINTGEHTEPIIVAPYRLASIPVLNEDENIEIFCIETNKRFHIYTIEIESGGVVGVVDKTYEIETNSTITYNSTSFYRHITINSPEINGTLLWANISNGQFSLLFKTPVATTYTALTNQVIDGVSKNSATDGQQVQVYVPNV